MKLDTPVFMQTCHMMWIDFRQQASCQVQYLGSERRVNTNAGQLNSTPTVHVKEWL